MPQLRSALVFNLADALARDPKFLAHFLQRVLGPIFKAESHFDQILGLDPTSTLTQGVNCCLSRDCVERCCEMSWWYMCKDFFCD